MGGVVNMELPIAPVGRIITNAGAHRVSNDARDALAKALEVEGELIAQEAVNVARHSGRKTVEGKDIIFVFNIIEKIEKINKNRIINVTNSQGVVTDSNNVIVDAKTTINTFEGLYEQSYNYENGNEIKEKIELIENELQKTDMNQSKIKKTANWLKKNANWTIPTIAKILLVTLGL